jgi:uncharacterized membrane protein
MDIFVSYSALFFAGGVIGWVIELFFRRFVSAGRWVNPGFLTGPILPLYGFGLIGFYFLANVIPWSALSSQGWLNYLIEVLAIGALMTLLEYIAGLIFIKGLKVQLWDYSTQPYNFQGIICPFFSAIWTLFGILYIFVLNNTFLDFSAWVLRNELAMGMLLSFFYGILSVDFGWSIGLLAKVRQAVADSGFVVSWDKIKDSFQDQFKKAKKRYNWLFALSAKKDEWQAMFNEYLGTAKKEAEMRAEEQKKKQEIKIEKSKTRLSKKKAKGKKK